MTGSLGWMGPILTIGGGAAAIKGFSASSALAATRAVQAKAGVELAANASKLPGFLKWGGIAAAIGGVALTAVGMKMANDRTKATEAQATAAIEVLSNTATQQMQMMQDQSQQQIASLQQQIAAGGGAAGTGAGAQTSPIGAGTTAPNGTTDPTGAGTTGTGVPAVTDPNTGQPIPGTGGTPATGAGEIGLQTTVVPGSTGGAGSAGTTGGVGSTTPGAWSLQSVVGRSVNLAAGTTPSGTVIADAGSYRIEQTAGDPNGYASLDEANAAARQTMSTDLMGSRFLRWMVVEHGGRFYGVVAKQLGSQDAGQPLSADLGNVVAWSAMNHISDNGATGWKAYSWSSAGGAQAIDVPYDATSVFGGGVGGGGGAPVGSTTTTTGQVTGGGNVAAFDPAGEVGRTFAISAASTAEGDTAAGGQLQIQRFVEASTGGFGSPEEAAAAARSARTQSGDTSQWKRWVTLQGADNRFYVYEGSIVKRPTAQLQAGAPVHVFGAGFAEYFDGSAGGWKAVRDAA